jgi:hypothetical protein
MNVLKVGQGTNDLWSITDSVFKNCRELIIKFDPCYSDSPKLSIERCGFRNIKTQKSPGIEVNVKYNNKGSTIIKNCLFESLDISTDFIKCPHSSKALSHEAGIVEDCTFKNCIARGNAKLIEQSTHYWGLFGKEKSTQAIYIRNNCTGLDFVRRG